MDRSEFERIIKAQDEAISNLGVEVWIGMEPTFTRRFAETPEWLSEALGPEKLRFAYELLREVHTRQPGGVVLHTLGRQYIGEDFPRWSLGYCQARNNQFTWQGPQDPCLIHEAADIIVPIEVATIEMFWQALNDALNLSSWQATAFTVSENIKYRILFRCDSSTPTVDINGKPQLARASIHKAKIPRNGLTDDLAANGDLLLCLDRQSEYLNSIVVELPEVSDVDIFVQLLNCIALAANQTSIESLVIQGFPPPVDASVAWTTITPDPAVIEINQAPSENGLNFYRRSELCYDAAQAVGLHPYRLQYNGMVSDSGGGGQFTLGGPKPLSSPFFRFPKLLPRLVRYANAHPSLSYWFASSSIGSSSQSPRADEGVCESFCELAVALEQLEKNEHPEPEFIWRSLSPFLVDPSGNPHRSELNVEKLWNPHLLGRGRLGLVEFRAFGMSRSSQCATAIAVLLRSIVAMLSQRDIVSDLINHGVKLHDKYGLPFYLCADLQNVFTDLQLAGLAIHDSIKHLLLREPVRFIGNTVFHDCKIELQQAMEFWPLVGDVASQEGGDSRLVDASTTRLQVTLAVEGHQSNQLDGWELWLDGYCVPLRLEQNSQGFIKVVGLRYRNFLPNIGLHPGIGARDSITLVLAHCNLSEALKITYYEWHPQGLPYSGLPTDMNDAKSRRSERFISEIISLQGYNQPKTPPASAMTDYCLDLRRLPFH